jgi:flagellin
MGTNAFSVKLGDPGVAGEGLSEIYDNTTNQGGIQLDATVQGESGLADISNQASAESAVAMLAKAVSNLGQAQAVVGRGQNQFSYAVNLAQSQLSNQAAAESRIRDADLANEAANMTKAQVLLQAGVAALAQANSAPQQILSLLRG